MKILEVDLGDRSYPIFIGKNTLLPEHLTPYVKGKQVMLVTNDTVAPLYLDKVVTLFRTAGFDVAETILPDGEAFKDLEHVNLIFDRLLESRFNRTVTLVALGGGVVGDMTGFAAACYQRGVPFIQIPTTVLSQVDSSVGGKTGVNHPRGKNMIGAFHQPQSVVIDIDLLSTLPDRELSAGLAEVIKYGLIYDIEFLAWLEANMSELMARQPEQLAYAIHRSCQIKAEVVAQDERESGIRALLNLGHTFGHAIEAEQGYGNWLHGEAVAVGMLMATDLSCRLGWLDSTDYQRVKNLILAAGLPVVPPEGMSADSFLEHMAVDKKVIDGKLRLILLPTLGEAIQTAEFDLSLLMQTLHAAEKLGCLA